MEQTIIIGYGIVNGLGCGKEEIKQKIVSGKQGFSTISKFDVEDCKVKIVGEINDTGIPYIKPDAPRLRDRVTAYMMTAIDEALIQSEVDLRSIDPSRIGLVVGTSLAGTELAENFYESYKKTRKGYLKSLIQYPLHTCADILSSYYGITGPKVVISTACSSSGAAMGLASDFIARGLADIVICGGGDPLVKISYAGFYSLKNMSESPCSPFSTQSVGLTLGEGAAFYILSGKNFAEKNGKKLLGEIKGYGIECDSYHPTAPDPQGKGAAQAMESAIGNAGYRNKKKMIEFISAHGTGTSLNDVIETRTIKRVFGEEYSRHIRMSSTKSMVGHTLGAAGATAIGIGLLGMEHDFIPPTMNFTVARQGCDLNYVPNAPEQAHPFDNYMANAFAFGGNNVSILLGKPEERQLQRKNLQEPIVLTASGCISALGNSPDELYEAVLKGESGIRKEDEAVEGFCRNRSEYSGRIADFSIRNIGRFRNARRMDRISQLAVSASYLALKNAKIAVTPLNNTEIGVICSTGTGPIESLAGFYDGIIGKGLANGDSALFSNTVANAACGYIGIETGIKGYSTTVTNGNVSGLMALALGENCLVNGYLSRVLVGCSDEYSLPLHRALTGLGVVRHDRFEPQDRIQAMGEHRKGVICGEGSCFYLMEPLSSAEASGRKVMGEIVGIGISSDICRISENDKTGTGMKNAIQAALSRSGLSRDDIDVVFAAASGHSLRDHSEGRGIRLALEDVPVFMVSNYMGDTFGSVGLFSLGIGLMAMKHDTIPAMGEDYGIDPLIGVNAVFGKPIKKKINTFIVTANSFGGLNMAVIVKKTD